MPSLIVLLTLLSAYLAFGQKAPDPRSVVAQSMAGTPAPKIRSPRPTALCIVDDSADMVGPDGLSTSSDGVFPALSYLMPALRCGTCCYWSAFQASAVSCVDKSAGAQCSMPRVSVPRLTMTSDLVSVAERVLMTPPNRDLYLITNGLDWRTEGGDTQFRVEMDIGLVLSGWLQSRPDRDIVLGVLQDNTNQTRRPNMIVGFLEGIQASRKCDIPIRNLPNQIAIALAHFSNPSTHILEAEAMRLRPSVAFETTHGGAVRSRSLEISSEGVVQVPESWISTFVPGDTSLNLRFILPSEHSIFDCWQVVANFSGKKSPMSCTSDSRAVNCKIKLPDVSGMVRRGIRMDLELQPTLPPWIQRLPGTHALRLTAETFRTSAAKRVGIRPARQGAERIGGLILRAAP